MWQNSIIVVSVDDWYIRCYRRCRKDRIFYLLQGQNPYTNECVSVVIVMKPHCVSKWETTPHGSQSKIISMCWVPLADLPKCTDSQCDHRDFVGHKQRKAHDCAENDNRAASPESTTQAPAW